MQGQTSALAKFYRSKGKRRAAENTALSILQFVVSLCVARAVIGNAVAPLSLALCAAASPFAAATTLGGVIGYMSTVPDIQGIRYAACVLMLMGIRRAVFAFGKKERAYLAPAVSAALCFVTGLATSAEGFLDLSAYIASGLEAVICALFALAFKRAYERRLDIHRLSELPAENFISVILMAAIIVFSLCGFNLYGFCAGDIVAAIAVLVAAANFGPVFGCAAGAAAGSVLAFASGSELLFAAAALSCTGFITGLTARWPRLAAAAAGLAAGSGAAIALGAGRAPVFVAELLLAAVVFTFLPKKLFKAGQVAKKNTFGGSNVVESASSALKELAESIQSSHQNEEDISTVWTAASERICSRCARSHVCWGRDFDRMTDAFNNLVPELQKGAGGAVRLPDSLFKSCSKKQQFEAALKAENERRIRLLESKKRNAHRNDELVLHYKNISQALRNIADNNQAVIEIDLQNRITRKLSELGMVFSDISAVTQNGSLMIRMELPRLCGTGLTAGALSEACEKITGKRFTKPEIQNSSTGTSITLESLPLYALKISVSCKTKEGEVCSGDSHCLFDAEGGKKVIVLSDGMGSGERAAGGSRFTVSFLKRLIENGISRDTAVKIVNTSLMIRDEECFATCDIAVVDLHCGKTEIIKAGAAPTFVYHNGRLTRFESRSLPGGILAQAETESAAAELFAGDLLIMLSDGIVANGEDAKWLEALLADYDGKKPLSDEIIAVCCRLKKTKDDMTCITAQLTRTPENIKRPVYAGENDF